jgi:hypothetical protein
LGRGLRLELQTEAGRVNALLIVLCVVFVIGVGTPNLAEQLIGIWSDSYHATFPLLGSLAILMGGGLICVLMLLLLEPLLQARRFPRRRTEARAKPRR